MVVACVEIVAVVQDFAVACIGLRLQLQPSQFWYCSTAALYILVVPSVVTLFYITSVRLKEDCGVRYMFIHVFVSIVDVLISTLVIRVVWGTQEPTHA